MDDGFGARGYVRTRIANACDACKARKIKCDGTQPCGRCSRRRQPQHCQYSPGSRRLRRANRPYTPVSASRNEEKSPAATGQQARPPPQPAVSIPATSATSAPSVAADEHDDTEVPREARLFCDPQGKLLFVGDCAPLSFFQTVRRLVTTHVDPNAFAPETSQYSVLENASRGGMGPLLSSHPGHDAPAIKLEDIADAVTAYQVATAGLVDLFDDACLLPDLILWVQQQQASRDWKAGSDDMVSAVYYLVLAIGTQTSNEPLSQSYFDVAQRMALANLGSGSPSPGTVQVFVLVTVYMLGACQISAAFLFLGVAARAAYSVGIHRAEVNARFGPDDGRQRDRLWKSLRVVDLFLSTAMGRPPATSDVDCTVSYRELPGDENAALDLLNASVQIFLIIEEIVLEIYSRRKISLQLTDGISRELRRWSSCWLSQLKTAVAIPGPDVKLWQLNGACQALSSYYYAVILVSRPFLMFESRRRLRPEMSADTPSLVSGRSKLADACIDAASLMIDPIRDLIDRGLMNRRAPVVVSWLFASSLVLGLAVLAGFGRVMEKRCQQSISLLEFFARGDAHAVQYSLVARSLLTTALDHLDKKETKERQQRTQRSSQLFGLIPLEHKSVGEENSRIAGISPPRLRSDTAQSPPLSGPLQELSTDLDSAFPGLEDGPPFALDLSLWSEATDHENDTQFGSLNLFPMLDAGGHIDLAHFF